MFATKTSRPQWLLVALALSGLTHSCRAQQPTQLTVSSIAELREAMNHSNQQVTLKPGEYVLDSGGKNPFLDFSGANSTFIFKGCHLKVDSRQLKGFGKGHENTVNLVQLSGDNVTVDGLTLSVEVVDGVEGVADMSSNMVQLVGNGDVLKNCDITTRGSRPYAFGDAFGKGGRPANGNQEGGVPFFAHSKMCGIRVGKGAGNVTLDNIQLHMRSFGHGIYLQEAAHDITVKNCVIEGGEMANSNDVIADPLYQKYGVATYNEKIPTNIRLSKSEDGIRVYGASADYGAIKNVRVENTKVYRMRDAYALGDMEGKSEIINSEAWDCETGFTPAKGGATIQGCKGNAVYGPLLFFRRGGNDVIAQVELAGDETPQGLWPIAIISGQNNKVSLTKSGKAKYSENAFVLVSQAWREWRHRPTAKIDSEKGIIPSTENRIDNNTGQIVVLGTKATQNIVTSNAPVIDKGQGNTLTAPAWQPREIRLQDTWGEYQIYPAS